jgi:hypothetical protein
MKYLLNFIFSVVACLSVRGQTGLGSWNILNIKSDINKKWSLFGEGQIRSLSFYNEFHYYEVKGGVQYRLDKNFTLSVGAGSFDTYRGGGNFTQIVNDETRIWQQVQMTQQLKRLRFEHRYRAEQRFTTNGFRNRFRYRLGAVVPLNRATVAVGTLYFNAWNELFFTNRAPYFERNRLGLILGYVAHPRLTLQLGWVNQFDYRINDETGRDFLQIGFMVDAPPVGALFKKAK